METQAIPDPMEPFRLLREKPRRRPLDSPRDDGRDWLDRTPQERIAAVEFLRAQSMEPGHVEQRLSRLLVITRRA